MTNKPKNKGRRKEHLVKKWFEHNGFNAFRTPLSGALRDFPGDVQVRLNNEVRLKVEVKARKNPPKVFTGWIGGNDLLVLMPDQGIRCRKAMRLLPMRTYPRFYR